MFNNQIVTILCFVIFISLTTQFTSTAQELSLGNDTTICFGDEIILNAGSGFVSYLWQDGITNDSTFTVSLAGMYHVTVVDGVGNTLRDTVQISVVPPPTINLGSDTTFCDSAPLILNAGNQFIAYLWNEGSTTQSIEITEAGTYSVQITDAMGCKNSDTIRVSTKPSPEAQAGENAEFCLGDSVQLTATGGVNYQWNSELPHQSYVSPVTSTDYVVTVFAENGCTDTDTLTVIINQPPKVLNVSVSDDKRATISVESVHEPVYVVHYGSRLVEQPENVITGLMSGNSYIVDIVDTLGCKTSVTIVIPVEQLPITIPSAFTPNGDGFNDRWEIVGIEDFPEAHIKIFDKWGKYLAHYRGKDEGWDGMYNNQYLPTDTYWYVVALENGYQAIGSVTLIRN